MLIDLRDASAPTELDTGVCIAGAGAAGDGGYGLVLRGVTPGQGEGETRGRRVRKLKS